MPHDDQIVARVPLVNFYALDALRKPDVLGGTPGPSAIIKSECADDTDYRDGSNSWRSISTPREKMTGPPRYNIAPTQPIPVIRQHAKEPRGVLSLVRWGLIPSWAKDMSGAAGVINARSETAVTKPAFRDPIKFRRCLVPADGFYEWVRKEKIKQPFSFEVNDGELFAFSGLWDRWRDPSGQWIKSCSILTTTPNAVTAAVHDRMPVILRKDNYDLWLDPGMTNVELLSDLLRPFDAHSMRSYPVSSCVNQCKTMIRNALPPLNCSSLHKLSCFLEQIFRSNH